MWHAQPQLRHQQAAEEGIMFKRKTTQSDIAAAAKTNASQDAGRHDVARPETAEMHNAWNSWGERNPLTLGSFGRW
jgi:hypothetical protein